MRRCTAEKLHGRYECAIEENVTSFESYHSGPDILKRSESLLYNELLNSSGDPLWQYTQPSENILKGNRLSKSEAPSGPQPEISNHLWQSSKQAPRSHV